MSSEEVISAVSAIVQNRGCVDSYGPDGSCVEHSVIEAMIGALIILGVNREIGDRARRMVLGEDA